ncbi:hypothetical protein AB0T95_17810, partial [Escherichia coli]
SIAKGMGARTSMSENELDILTRYFQYNAKDITEKQITVIVRFLYCSGIKKGPC